MRPGLAVQLRHQLWIVLAAGAVFFIGLGNSRLWDEDETEYSRVAREMMIRGDWVVPTFNYQPWLEKPVFVYWLMIGSFHLFGVTEFAARFPSAVFAVGTALLAYHLGRRLFRPRVGLWAGLVLATTLNFVIIGRAATHDAALIFCTTASLLAYVLAMGRTFWRRATACPPLLPPSGGGNGGQAVAPSRLGRFRAVLPKSWWQFVLMYLPLGVAVMIKGPLGVLLPIASLGMFVWISGTVSVRHGMLMSERPVGVPPSGGRPAGAGAPPAKAGTPTIRLLARLTALLADFPAATWAMRPFTLAAIVLVIAAPWFALAEIRTHGGISRVFFWEHNVQYILHPQQGHAGSSFYFYPLALIVGFFPWTIALALGAVSMARRLRGSAAGQRACMLSITWCVTWIVVMSLVGTKLPHYIVPTYPLLSVVAGLAIVEWTAVRSATARRAPTPVGSSRRLFACFGNWVGLGGQGSRQIWMGTGILLLVGVGTVIVIGLPPAFHRWLPGQPSFNWLGMILAIGGLASWLLQWGGRRAAAAVALAFTAGAFYLGLSGVAASHFSREQSSVQMAEAVERLAPPAAPVAVYRAHLPGTVFYLDRRNPVVALFAEGNRPADETKPIEHVRLTANGAVVDLRQLFADRPDSLLITDPQGLTELRPLLPADAIVLDQRPRFPKTGELVVVGRRATTASATDSLAAPASITSAPDHVQR
jgi:4-amino-4-deoxy-L-arabinose transferase-like glycosyltransferase